MSRDGRKVEPQKVEVLWASAQMASVSYYQGFILKLDAFFLDDEVLMISYKFTGSMEDTSGSRLMICGVARNGQEKDKFFSYTGKVSESGGRAVIKQELDIPDYRQKPLGPYVYHKHRLFWVVDAGVEVEALDREIETEHDFSSDGTTDPIIGGLKSRSPWNRDGITSASCS